MHRIRREKKYDGGMRSHRTTLNTIDQVTAAQAAIADGMADADVAEQFGVSGRTARTWRTRGLPADAMRLLAQQARTADDGHDAPTASPSALSPVMIPMLARLLELAMENLEACGTAGVGDLPRVKAQQSAIRLAHALTLDMGEHYAEFEGRASLTPLEVKSYCYAAWAVVLTHAGGSFYEGLGLMGDDELRELGYNDAEISEPRGPGSAPGSPPAQDRQPPTDEQWRAILNAGPISPDESAELRGVLEAALNPQNRPPSAPSHV